MSSGVANGIRYRKDDSTSSFLLDDSSIFSATSYKILKNLDAESFIPCFKSLYNGCIKLSYFTGGYRTFTSVIQEGNHQVSLALLEDLVRVVRDTRDNGFLQARNMIFNGDLVLVCSDKPKVRLMYVPVSVPLSGMDDSQAIQSLYVLCKSVGASMYAGSTLLQDICETPGYGRADLDYLLERVHAAATYDFGQHDAAARAHAGEEPHTGQAGDPTVWEGRSPRLDEQGCAAQSGTYVLKQTGRADNVALPVTQQVTNVGKSPAKSDLVVDSSTAISRLHCRLLLGADGSLRVSDAGSTNGTFVDGRRLAPDEEVQLGEGSRLRLADVEFVVSRGR